MSICTIWFGFSIANLLYCLFLILHFKMFKPCLFSTLQIVFVLSDISFSLFNLNLIRLHPNLFVIRKSSICCSISYVTFTGCILSGFLLLSSRPFIPYFRYLFFHLQYVFLDIWYLLQISITESPVHSFSCIRLNLVCNSILYTLPSSRTRKCYPCQ